jgi:hypothetical protein
VYSVVLAFSRNERDVGAHSKFHTGQNFDACFDFNFPFRPLLEFVAECLRQEGVTVDLDLPDYIEFEDFVEGYLRVDGRPVEVYFEHSLSYLSLGSDSQQDLIMVMNASQGKVFQHEGYGLKDAQLR